LKTEYQELKVDSLECADEDRERKPKEVRIEHARPLGQQISHV
jgi:hypothetical protein